MTWFKIDDSFYRSGKVRRLGRDRVACVGLWTLCGVWSADNLTDGFVPWEVVRQWDPALKRTAVLLEVGLWEEGERDSEDGAVFHDWHDWQPSRDQVIQRRKSDAERRARWRNAKSNGGPPDRDPSGSQGESRDVSRRDGGVQSRVGSVLPDPTRPDPSLSTLTPDRSTQVSSVARMGARGHRGETGPAHLAATARTATAATIAARWADNLPRRLPRAELIRLGQGVDEALGLGWTEQDITERGLPHWGRSGKGAALFVAIASEAICRDADRPRSRTSDAIASTAAAFAEWETRNNANIIALPTRSEGA